MNQLTVQGERIPMDAVGVTNTGTGSKIAPQNLGEVVKFAEVMCRADIALPKHLRGNAGACMAVAMQALEWQMSPFAVASKSYEVGGRIAYEAQLIAAVVNTRSGIKGRLKYRYDGEGNSLTCTVTGTLDGEECVYTSPTVGSITTKNSPLWKSDPQQQLGYFAARSWARRHCPEVILGVYDREEVEDFRGPDKAKNITPTFDPLSDEPIAETQASQTVLVDEEYDEMTGELLGTHSGSSPSEPDYAEGSSPSAEADTESSTVSASTSSDRDILIKYAGDILVKAADPNVSPAALAAIEKRYAAGEFPKLSPEGVVKARAISASMRAIANDPARLDGAIEHYAEVLECDPTEIGG